MARTHKETPQIETQYEAPSEEVVSEVPASAEEVVQETQTPKAKLLIRAVHGTMVHPYVPMDIRTDAISEVDEIDSWIQAQIDEGKIVRV